MMKRPRRLRSSQAIRSLVQENRVSADDFLVPLFILEGEKKEIEISSMPGYFKRSIDYTLRYIEELTLLGIKAVLLFVQVTDELKDNTGEEALNDSGLMQRSIKAIKEVFPEVLVFTDIALDPFSSYGHDGIVGEGKILNDETLVVLSQMAVSHAKAGADFVAPSDMMDGRISAIRKELDKNQFKECGILSYSAKYASCFYGPFRDALDSAPGFGDKKTYQMDSANSVEAIKEVLLDVEEGADIVMVKPGIAYLDVLHQAKYHSEVPVASYQVSGEYAMICAASEKGWINREQAIAESLLSFKRAGADIIASYFAKEYLESLNKK
jgi:porphobilinogen synthase